MMKLRIFLFFIAIYGLIAGFVSYVMAHRAQWGQEAGVGCPVCRQ